MTTQQRAELCRPETTFGRAVSAARKAKGWSLRELADKVLREGGEPISQQYLNDIEHDRRSPTSDRMVQQIADALGIEKDWLYYLAGRFPEDVRRQNLSRDQVVRAMTAFRSASEFIQLDPYGDYVRATVIWQDDDPVTQKMYDILKAELADKDKEFAECQANTLKEAASVVEYLPIGNHRAACRRQMADAIRSLIADKKVADK